MFVLLRHDDDGVPDIALYGVQDWHIDENGDTTVWFPASSTVDEAEQYASYRPVAAEDGDGLYSDRGYLDEHIAEMTAKEETVVTVVPSVRHQQLYEYEDAGTEDEWATL